MDALDSVEVSGPGDLTSRPSEGYRPRATNHSATRRLPFTIRIARSEAELRKAVYIRHRAYARHLPALAELLKVPEPYDEDPASVVLIAESKLDGAPLGTMRIQTNRYRPLAIEQSVELPDWLQDRSLAEATRLGIAEGRIGGVVKTMLFKALFRYCVQTGVDWMVIGARAPLDRQYAALLFEDVFEKNAFVPLRHAGNIPHRVLAFDIETAEARWIAARHPLYDLFCNTHHPDIIDLHEGAAQFGTLARRNIRASLTWDKSGG
ncbi:MAG TPA: hypothetical protein VKP89_00035 [Burkholderiales bacterium]|nr:hypothetical protein [Burkholderiales bacterium]